MSALGSTVINKSAKRFAPKAPVRRSAASASAQTSARASADRQNQRSQTPQVATTHLLDVPSSALVSKPVQISAQRLPIDPQDLSPGDDFTTPLSAPTQTPRTHTSVDAILDGPRSRERPTAQQVSPRELHGSSEILALASNNDNEIQSASYNQAAVDAEELYAAANIESFIGNVLIEGNSTFQTPDPGISEANTIANSLESSEPPTKRRRIESLSQDEIDANIESSRASASLPLPSIERESVSQSAGSSSKSKNEASSTKPRVPGSKAPKLPKGMGVLKPPKKNMFDRKARGKRRMEDAATVIITDTAGGADDQANERTTKKRRGRHRAETPENAESIEIAPAVVTMADLCKDLRTGKKSKLETRMHEMDWTKIAKHQKEKRRAVAAGESPASEIVDQMPTQVIREQDERNWEQAASALVPQTYIDADGIERIDESSLRFDRHAAAEAEREAEATEIIEDDPLARRINSGSWMKREATESWNEESVNLFYDGLRMFGTDFEMISKMFPGRSRRSIKLKFCKEEKQDRERIKEALLGERMPVDLVSFQQISNTVLMDPKDLERDMAEDRKRLENEQAAEKTAMDDASARRVAAAAEEAAKAVSNDSSAKENEVQQASTAPGKGKRIKKSTKEKTARGQRVSAVPPEVLAQL